MNEKNIPVLNYIFYLHTKVELDTTFYSLAEVLRKINVTLIPIEPTELKKLDKISKNHLIVIRSDFNSAFSFNELRKEFIDSSMAQNKLMVYDVSSFSEIENAVKLENKNVYRYFQLPLNLKQIAMTIAVEFFKDKNNQSKHIDWPGGRRAKLPTMNESN